MTRTAIWLRAADHSAAAVTHTVQQLKQEFGTHFSDVFKAITADNGSEFAELSAQETTHTQVYFTYPFSSWEKGTNECHNRMLRRFIPKENHISDYSIEDILFFADRMNALPRKILGYHTPEELFEKELAESTPPDRQPEQRKPSSLYRKLLLNSELLQLAIAICVYFLI